MDYCLIRDGAVFNVIVADAEFVQYYSTNNNCTAVERGNLPVGIGCKYHDAKFWRDVPDLDGNGQPLGTTHEEEVLPVENPPA
jgi:hypothetical protein